MRAIFALSFAVALVSGTALAHGPQLQLTRDNDKITTRSVFQNEPYSALTGQKRVYVMPLLETAGVWYVRPNDELNTTTGQARYLSGPGIAYGYGATFTPGNHFDIHLIDGLKYWDGAGFTDPGDEQIEAYRTSGATIASSAITTDALTQIAPATMSFADFSAINANSHSSARYRLLGDGSNPGGGDDGVYLLSLSVSSTESAIDDSDPFYFVLHKNAQQAEIDAAVSDLVGDLVISPQLVQYVPEPSSAALLVLAMAVGAPRRRYRAFHTFLHSSSVGGRSGVAATAKGLMERR